MIIQQKKISENHDDSFWYDGLIADTKNGKSMMAVGEIRIDNTETNELVHDGSKERNAGFDFDLEDDRDLKMVEWSSKYMWVNNNWFEVGGIGEEVYHSYDVALERLEELEKIYRVTRVCRSIPSKAIRRRFKWSM